MKWKIIINKIGDQFWYNVTVRKGVSRLDPIGICFKNVVTQVLNQMGDDTHTLKDVDVLGDPRQVYDAVEFLEVSETSKALVLLDFDATKESTTVLVLEEDRKDVCFAKLIKEYCDNNKIDTLNFAQKVLTTLRVL